MNTYYNPVRTFQGYGSLEELTRLAREAALPEKKILLLVWGESVLEIPAIRSFCQREGERILSHVFTASNPELSQIFQVYKETEQMDIGLVIPVGGGSVLDVGKTLCCLYGKDISSEEELRQMIVAKTYGAPACPWIGIPTTAGTGSEVTCWATVWDSPHNAKYSVDTAANYAYAALVDPTLADSMHLKLAVSSALDAAAHATESYWARATNSVSRALALEAVHTIMSNVDLLLENSSNKEAHDAMAKGSMLAGMAFSNTRTTACHSISYPLTMQFHIPHGVAVAMLLGPVLRLNFPAVSNPQALLKAYGAEKPEEVGQRVSAILAAAGHPTTLRAWGVTEDALENLAAHGITKGRADNNPVDLTHETVLEILRSIF